MPRTRTSRWPSTQTLSQSWPCVRRALVQHCGIVRGHGEKGDPRTAHCFADGTHLECCAPARAADYRNTNADGRAQGISTHNPLPLHEYNGRWCTCVSGDVCKQQFGTEAQWTAVWVRDLLVLAVRGRPRCHGRPTGRLPPVRARQASLAAYVRLHPAFAQRVKTYVARVSRPSAPQGSARTPSQSGTRRRRGRRTRSTATRSNTGRSLPLCTHIPLDIKRGPDHPKADLQCLSPTGKTMAYPRKHSRRECMAYRRQGHAGSTPQGLCHPKRHMASLLPVRAHGRRWTQWLNTLWRDGMHKLQHQPTTLGRWGLSAAEWEARTVRATRLTTYDHCGCEAHPHEGRRRSDASD